MKKRWFTLIEILIVIVIISILLALSLGISGGRVQILREKYSQEQLVSTYNTLFSRNFLTNYYGDSLYSNLVIDMKQWEPWFSYAYNDASGNPIYTGQTNIEWNIVVESLTLDGAHLDDVQISFEPYKFWCKLADLNYQILDIALLVDDKKTYCYRINSDLCRLEKISNCGGY